MQVCINVGGKNRFEPIHKRLLLYDVQATYMHSPNTAIALHTTLPKQGLEQMCKSELEPLLPTDSGNANAKPGYHKLLSPEGLLFPLHTLQFLAKKEGNI